ncbi:MAG: S8 family peptidase [Verrucomicrobia bacterium]|nr:S8 family peptidase [Verrucomicrobiota bacterium]
MEGFPHLHLTLKDDFTAKYPSNPPQRTAEELKLIEWIKANPAKHASTLRGILEGLEKSSEVIEGVRLEENLPHIPADTGFLLRIPEKTDVDALSHALGLELVAETEEGLMFVSTSDLSFPKLSQVLEHFAAGTGGGSALSVLDIYHKSDDPNRLKNILSPDVYSLLPLKDKQQYIFELGLQTASSTRTLKWPRVSKRKSESQDDFIRRREDARNKARQEGEEVWSASAERRVDELKPFVLHYGGEFLDGMMYGASSDNAHGVVFPDCVQVRIQMTGEGFRDIISNFAHLFEVSLPPDVEQPNAGEDTAGGIPPVTVRAPSSSAATVCVIDSGIQENHRWLQSAVHHSSSRCFIPGYQPDDVADQVESCVASGGHGTRVAGAVLYPREIPKEGEIQPIAWLQNARVLNEKNKLSKNLSPESYLESVVHCFHAEPKFTKIFNHSINSSIPCPKHRMTAWAAKIDQLSHQRDVLFVQSAGNLCDGVGNLANPGLRSHLGNGLQHPEQLLEDSSRLANPAQSLHALTVGSVAHEVFDHPDARSFAAAQFEPSAFSRSGYAPPWRVVKPEVVELGGDLVHSRTSPMTVRARKEQSVELLRSTLYGGSAFAKDGVGTSFAAPKVAHIAAKLQNLYPTASPLLYRTLIVQSARWPEWAEQENDADKVLRLVGYGLPSLERATSNADHRVTLITPEAREIPSKQLHLYTVTVPANIREAARDHRIRMDITLAYTAEPRRTRVRRNGYLETWLDWHASAMEEPVDNFLKRVKKEPYRYYPGFHWKLHNLPQYGDATGTRRTNGSAQKDWALFDAHKLPDEFAIAVCAHIGWNHREGAGLARYCMAVSFEALDADLPVYTSIQNVNVEIEEEISTNS